METQHQFIRYTMHLLQYLFMVHTAKHPYCQNIHCRKCHANVSYHQVITGASLQADVQENDSLAAQLDSLRGVMWDIQKERVS